jgi:hypothetical protein
MKEKARFSKKHKEKSQCTNYANRRVYIRLLMYLEGPKEQTCKYQPLQWLQNKAFSPLLSSLNST